MNTRSLAITFLVCNPDLSGGDRIIAEQARALKQSGHKVRVIGVDTYDYKLRDYARFLIKDRKLPTAHIRTDHFDRTGIGVEMIKRPNGPCADDIPDADIIIATWWETAEWIAGLAPAKGQKVYYIQGYEPWYPGVSDSPRAERTYCLPFQQIGVSQWLCDKVNSVSGSNRCTLVENGIDMDVFHAPARNKQPVPTVGYMYSFAAFKNPNLALDSIRHLQTKISNLQFISFGAYAPVPDYPLPENTQFHLRPTPAKINQLYASCDVWLLSSDHEGFGLPLLEAMACRTPVVATKAGASWEIVTDNTGRLCTERSVEAFSACIEDILQLSEPQWRTMSDHGVAMARRYSWARAGKQFEAALFKAIR